MCVYKALAVLLISVPLHTASCVLGDLSSYCRIYCLLLHHTSMLGMWYRGKQPSHGLHHGQEEVKPLAAQQYKATVATYRCGPGSRAYIIYLYEVANIPILCGTSWHSYTSLKHSSTEILSRNTCRAVA